MADHDGPPADFNDPADALPAAAKPVAPAPRVNPPNINSPKETPPADGPPGFNAFLEWMRNQGGEPEAGAPAQRGPLPKEKKKFQRRDADAKTDAPAGPTAEVPEPSAIEAASEASRRLPPTPRCHPVPAAVRPAQTPVCLCRSR